MNIQTDDERFNRLGGEQTPHPADAPAWIDPLLVRYTFARRTAALIEQVNNPWRKRDRELEP